MTREEFREIIYKTVSPLNGIEKTTVNITSYSHAKITLDVDRKKYILELLNNPNYINRAFENLQNHILGYMQFDININFIN